MIGIIGIDRVSVSDTVVREGSISFSQPWRETIDVFLVPSWIDKSVSLLSLPYDFLISFVQVVSTLYNW